MSNNKQTIILEVENKPGVLAKVASLCRRRRYNIESLTVSTTKNPKISQMTIVFFEQKSRIEQIANQINKLIEVINIEITSKNVITRELILLVLKNQAAVDKLLNLNSDITSVKKIKNNNLTLEITSDGKDIEKIINDLNFETDVEKIVRSGLVALKTCNT